MNIFSKRQRICSLSLFNNHCLKCFRYLLLSLSLSLSGPGVLAFPDGGPGGGGTSHEGLFETNELMRRENSQGAVQRAQAAATKARALAM